MKTFRDRTKAATIFLVLMLTMASTLITVLPLVNAIDIDTYAFLTVSPSPVGVGQPVTIFMWLDKLPPLDPILGSWNASWANYTLTVTKPDGTTQSLGPFKSDSTAFAWAPYAPDMIGTYYFQFSFSGQTALDDNYYKPSTSAKVALTVQEEPIAEWPAAPLPTDYWERPINAENREWYTIGGNWLGSGTYTNMWAWYNASGNFNPYTKAPNSAHIVWTKPLQFGGLIGGQFGGGDKSNYYTGKLYEPVFSPAIIINGVLYYNTPAPPREGYYAVDLRTGQTLWWHNSTGPPFMSLAMPGGHGGYGFAGITMGQVYNYKSPNQEGGIPYLWFTQNTTWYMYDAVTGNLILTLSNARPRPANPYGGTTAEGPDGELLVYFLDGANNWLAMWNSSRVSGMLAGETGTAGWQWRPPVGATLDWRTGIQWNVTTQAYPGQSIAKISRDIILATTGGSEYNVPQKWQMEIAYNASTGKQVWAQNRTFPTETTAYWLMGPLMDDIYTEFQKGPMQWYGFDAYTGEQIWGPTEPYENAWGSQISYSMGAYGNFYALSSDGVHAFNIVTGQHLWDFYAEPTGLELPGFSTYPFERSGFTIADGKVFATTGIQYGVGLFRGAALYAIDAKSGKQLWSISGFYQCNMPVADGYLIAFNGYDNQLYCFGKGLTATIVSASPKVVAKGSSVVIEGTVTDQSPGDTCLGIPAAGTPAIADEYMTEWMEYLHMQKPMPTNAAGVEVSLDTIDPNGNFVHIGTATSDMSGLNSYMWTPEHEGKYTIIATFEGSESYWRSTAETALGVSEASAKTASEPAAPTPPYEMYTIYTVIAIIIAVAMVGLMLLSKKRQRSRKGLVL